MESLDLERLGSGISDDGDGCTSMGVDCLSAHVQEWVISTVIILSRNYRSHTDTVMLRVLELSARPLSVAGASGIPFIGIAGIIVQDIVDICKELKLHKVRLVNR